MRNLISILALILSTLSTNTSVAAPKPNEVQSMDNLLGAAVSETVVNAGKGTTVADPSQSPLNKGGSEWGYTDLTTGMEFVFVKGGCFQMGDTFGDGNSDEKPVHEVCVDGFSIGKYEVTQAQWEKVMGSNPSNFKQCGGSCPVENVSWNDIQTFILKLNSQTGKTYCLPTEAEWEYAARSGGKSEKFSGGSDLDSVAWYASNSGSKTHYVGKKQPNGLGIYDMSGNVWEWCQDWYDENYYRNSPRDNPQGPTSGNIRVLRGGSWDRSASSTRVSHRGRYVPGSRYLHGGFRLTRNK